MGTGVAGATPSNACLPDRGLALAETPSHSARPAIRQGSVYWLKDCKPLDDENVKDRPVVVVDDYSSISADGPIIVVACSTKCRDSEPDKIRLPDRGRIPQTKSGLSAPSWAIPRWNFPVERSRLTEYKGHLTGSVLKAVIAAYLARIRARRLEAERGRPIPKSGQ
jgi:mRNA-degrading endonuclease toxin of MazEF toxin-antitoxin module